MIEIAEERNMSFEEYLQMIAISEYPTPVCRPCLPLNAAIRALTCFLFILLAHTQLRR